MFRHEIMVRHSSPFFTSAILALTPPAPLSLQNYTAFADVLALPLIPRLGIVATFNLMTLFAIVLSAYAMFLYARARTGDAWAAWIGGAAFGFSSFMMFRATAHLSLVLAAPLPVFGLLMLRMSRRPTYRLAIASGAVVAWAFFCDPYYAVYCVLILLFMVGHSAFTLDFLPSEYPIDLAHDAHRSRDLRRQRAHCGGRALRRTPVRAAGNHREHHAAVHADAAAVRAAHASLGSDPAAACVRPSPHLGHRSIFNGWHRGDSGRTGTDAVGVHLAPRVASGGEPVPAMAQQLARDRPSCVCDSQPTPSLGAGIVVDVAERTSKRTG